MEQSVTTAYSREQAEEYDDLRFRHPAGQRIHNSELRLLLWGLGHVDRDGRILEVGCGTGRLLLAAREHGYRVEGADASADMLNMLRRKLGADAQSLPLHVGEAAHLPHEDGTFDMVYAIRLLNQTESPEYALSTVREMMRITRAGGFVLAEFISRHRPQWGTAKGRTTTRLSPADVAAAGREAGGSVVETRGAFFLGMQSLQASPKALLGATDMVNRGLGRLLPRMCARVYMLLRKDKGA